MSWSECPICILLLSNSNRKQIDVEFHMQEHAEKKVANIAVDDYNYQQAHVSKKGFCSLCFDSSECLSCHNYYLHFLNWQDWLGSGICDTTWKDRYVLNNGR